MYSFTQRSLKPKVGILFCFSVTLQDTFYPLVTTAYDSEPDIFPFEDVRHLPSDIDSFPLFDLDPSR